MAFLEIRCLILTESDGSYAFMRIAQQGYHPRQWAPSYSDNRGQGIDRVQKQTHYSTLNGTMARET